MELHFFKKVKTFFKLGERLTFWPLKIQVGWGEDQKHQIKKIQFVWSFAVATWKCMFLVRSSVSVLTWDNQPISFNNILWSKVQWRSGRVSNNRSRTGNTRLKGTPQFSAHVWSVLKAKLSFNVFLFSTFTSLSKLHWNQQCIMLDLERYKVWFCSSISDMFSNGFALEHHWV